MMIGTMLGPYRVLEKLREGGMGEVYHARDTQLKREVTLKVLSADDLRAQLRVALAHRVAHRYMRDERPNHPLQTTALGPRSVRRVRSSSTSA